MRSDHVRLAQGHLTVSSVISRPTDRSGNASAEPWVPRGKRILDRIGWVLLRVEPVSAIEAARLVAPGTVIGLVVGNRMVGLPHTVEVHLGQ
jgi:hypothetical protein